MEPSRDNREQDCGPDTIPTLNGGLVDFQHIIEAVGRLVDFAGVAVMVIGAVVSIPMALRGYQPRRLPADAERMSVYRAYRQLLGRSILLGLELLVAADIIRTVAVAPTYESVGVLGLIVLIRTFLSFSLELEITGRWPWQKEPSSSRSGPDGGLLKRESSVSET